MTVMMMMTMMMVVVDVITMIGILMMMKSKVEVDTVQLMKFYGYGEYVAMIQKQHDSEEYWWLSMLAGKSYEYDEIYNLFIINYCDNCDA